MLFTNNSARMDLSSPGHADYGKHLTKDELKSILRPHAAATEAVMTWLSEAGVQAHDITEDGEWINFVAPVERAEQVLETRFNVYRSMAGDKIRTLQYSIPEKLHG